MEQKTPEHDPNDREDWLDLELRTYECNKEMLLAESAGKWVVIKGDTIAGIFDTEEEAGRFGFHEFWDTAFMMRQILEHEPEYIVTSQLIDTGAMHRG